MKTLISFFLFVFITISVNGQCNLITEKDPYTGIRSRSTIDELVGTVGRTGSITLKLVEYIDKDTSMRLYVNIKRLSIRCIGRDSKILIKSGEVIIALKFSGRINCGIQFDDYAELSLEDINFLKQNFFDGMRVQYTKGYDDFNIKNKSDYFIRAFKCFE